MNNRGRTYVSNEDRWENKGQCKELEVPESGLSETTKQEIILLHID